MQPHQSREEALFGAAVELPPGTARQAFLDQACAGDSALRQRIDNLLAAHEQSGDLEPGADPGVKVTINLDLTEKEKTDDAVGQILGRFKLLEKIGEGGCGVVYVAEQTQPVRRRVALKVIKLGMDTKAVVARFEAERQALAMMDHPNIAKVLDAGTVEPVSPDPKSPAANPKSVVHSGRPYFVMELVRGIRITDYCDQNNLPTRDRLELFIKICQAIQHAHQKGIIHRDIKPSNILVTLHDGVPVPKVIDFGIAKATEGRLTDATVYTQLHQFIGTPAYMSPEQAEMSGLDIDTRSDIYSLGVLLYELLVGRTPFDAKELAASGLDQMRKTIREKEPMRPSTKFATLKGEELTTTAKRRSADITKLAHQLRGDLDWIVMKCLEKDRTRRYETANGLAADLKRHLNNEPVVARPPSSAYRFQKLVRRNKLVFAAGSAVAFALLLGIVVSTSEAIRATRAKQEALRAQTQEEAQREQANSARSQAEGLVSFMIEDLQPALEDYGRLPLLKQVDEKTVSYFDNLPPDLRSARTELARADALNTLSQILRALGDVQACVLKARQALDAYQELARKHPEVPEAAAGALIAEWNLYSYGPPHTTAELEHFEEDYLRRCRELYAKFPESVKVKQCMGAALWTRASLAASRFNKPQEAVTIALELQRFTQAGIARNPESKYLRRAYANGLVAVATAYQAAGDQGRAVQASQEAADYFDKALKEDPGNLALLGQAAEASQNLSYRVSAVSPKRSRDAELVARERFRTLTMLDPSNTGWRYSFVMSHMMECYYLEATGEIEATRQAFKKFDALLQDLVARGELKPLDAEKLPQNSIDLARLAALAGDKADAHAQIATAESRFKARYDAFPAGSFDRTLARIRWLNLEADVYSLLSEWGEVERIGHETISLVEDGLAQRPGDSELLLRRAVAQYRLGLALENQGNAAAAVPILEQAARGFRETPPVFTFTENQEYYAGYADYALADSLAKTGNTERAKNVAESLVTTAESWIAKHPENTELNSDLAQSLVLLAGMLDPTKPDESARRATLLERADNMTNHSDPQGRLPTDNRELNDKIKALRAQDKTQSPLH